MKRITMMLALAALLVVALTITAGTGFAKPSGCPAGEPGCEQKQSKKDDEVSPSQGNPPENAEEPFTETTTTTVERKGKSENPPPENNPHTEVTIVEQCFNNSGTHEFSDPSKCD
jgi:hypothetical protein